MFSSSLHRAARAARSCPNGKRPSRPTAPSIAPFSSHSHRRRHSSSKPPIPPNNGSGPTIPASSVKQVGTSRSDASKKPTSESSRLSKRKAAKAEPAEEVPQDNWTASLPSVPSLQHLNLKDVSLSTFYALYRPISITGPGPKEAQMEDIEKLFQPKPKSKLKPAHTEVVYTLSSALENLSEEIENKQTSQQDQAVTQKADLIKALTQRNDADSPQGEGQQQTVNVRVPNGAVKLVIQELQNRFRPFKVPPPPTPATQQELDAIDAENAASEANEEMLTRELETQVEGQDAEDAAARGRRDRRRIEAQMRLQQLSSQQKPLSETSVTEVFKTRGDTFSIDLDMQNGHFFTPHYDADAATTQPESSPRRLRVGNRIRRGFFVPVRLPLRKKPGMQVISVKRQRRLKMKKHKYKKLMRKTRNLRRKEGRL